MRLVTPETTLLHAKQLAATAGISEVRNITDLDRLNVSVFVSVRPDARGETFAFGKGLRAVDAEVGAYMEALEFYFSEPGVGPVATRWGTAREVSGGGDAILNFAPLLQREVDLDGPLLLASVLNLENGEECTVPAELVHYPAAAVGQSLFGSSTTGLASGNSVLEASMQALLELIERDIWSFDFVRSSSRLVAPATLPDNVREIVERAEQNGLRLKVRCIPNDYGLPFFAVFLFDPNNPSRRTFNGGWACDLDRNRALVRAVTEAAQARIGLIHGGRKISALRNVGADEAQLVQQHIAGVSDAQQQVAFGEVIDLASDGPLERQFDEVIARLRRVVQEPIYRVVFTPSESSLQVVRLLVPLLESLKENKIRVGRRLKSAIEAMGARAA